MSVVGTWDLSTGMNSLVYDRGIRILLDEDIPLTIRFVIALQSIKEDVEVMVESFSRTGTQGAKMDLAVLSVQYK